MKIRSMKAHSGALAALEVIDFHPGMNIIRGPNGIGKTTILEWTSLLGHICLLDQNESASGIPELEMRLCITRHDKSFIKWIRDLIDSNPIRVFFNSILNDLGISTSIFDNNVQLPDFVTINFYLKNVTENNLKSILVDEQGMKSSVAFSVVGDGDLVWDKHRQIDIGNILRALNAWSRPRQILSTAKNKRKRYSITPHTFARSHASSEIIDAKTAYAPSPVLFYLNTDMYEFGIGLDIRESPKDLRGNITNLLIERLQLVSPIEVPLGSESLTDLVPQTVRLELTALHDIQNAWARVFKDHPLNQVSVKKNGSGHSEADFDWEISIASREDGASFISSGENQALFVLAMLFGLAEKGSCMLLDEPELHLSFWSGSRLINEIAERCAILDVQAVIVTHLPHLYRSKVNIIPQDKLWVVTEADKKKHIDGIRMLYLYRSGDKLSICCDRDAITLAAKESHADVMEVVDGLRLAEKISILPKFFR